MQCQRYSRYSTIVVGSGYHCACPFNHLLLLLKRKWGSRFSNVNKNNQKIHSQNACVRERARTAFNKKKKTITVLLSDGKHTRLSLYNFLIHEDFLSSNSVLISLIADAFQHMVRYPHISPFFSLAPSLFTTMA